RPRCRSWFDEARRGGKRRTPWLKMPLPEGGCVAQASGAAAGLKSNPVSFSSGYKKHRMIIATPCIPHDFPVQ
ncbi:hypothetical protein ACQCR9_17205, partial [Ralstonia pseudosolanacearum]|uniref:hypothetical protein n=1 Tax=Ralstonia pseudosolanacearum TaxID=1310165 RepID=UPI003CF61A11